MLDADLAEIYGVSTKRLNQQFRRNRKRFPEDFAFQLNEQEAAALRLQFATSKKGRGGRRYRPFVFTEHGAVMLSNVLNSPVAIQASIMVARAFVKLRKILSLHKDLARRLDELERRVVGHDVRITTLVGYIRRLLAPPAQPPRKIGFQP